MEHIWYRIKYSWIKFNRKWVSWHSDVLKPSSPGSAESALNEADLLCYKNLVFMCFKMLIKGDLFTGSADREKFRSKALGLKYLSCSFKTYHLIRRSRIMLCFFLYSRKTDGIENVYFRIINLEYSYAITHIIIWFIFTLICFYVGYMKHDWKILVNLDKNHCRYRLFYYNQCYIDFSTKLMYKLKPLEKITSNMVY